MAGVSTPQYDEALVREVIRKTKTGLAESIDLGAIITQLYSEDIISTSQEDELETYKNTKGSIYATGMLLNMVIKKEVQVRGFMRILSQYLPWIEEKIQEDLKQFQSGEWELPGQTVETNRSRDMQAVEMADDAPSNGSQTVEDRTTKKLSRLCTDCRVKVARTTFGRQDVILTLSGAGRSFCFNLNQNIITQGMRQRITKAVEDAEALGYIRDAFQASLDPDIFAQVLVAMKTEDKTMHADKMEKAYHEEIDKHRLCDKCR